MNIKLFGKSIKLRDQHCTKNGFQTVPITDPYLNLYVRVTNVCNASCGFCSYHGEDLPFDLYKLYYIIDELTKKVHLNKLSCTGGEPTMEVPRIKNILNKTKEISSSTFTVVSTNGYDLAELDGFHSVDSIALSRHHHDDRRNRDIFKTTYVANKKVISAFQDKHKLHLSCNLMNGVIDSKDAVMEYLDTVAQLGVRDVGFVSLMPVNEFAANNQITFSGFDFSDESSILKTQGWDNMGKCQCSNYLYSPPSIPAVVRIYARHNIKPHEAEGCLVYDGEYLRTKFGGEIII